MFAGAMKTVFHWKTIVNGVTNNIATDEVIKLTFSDFLIFYASKISNNNFL
jgi:hypothetical protein